MCGKKGKELGRSAQQTASRCPFRSVLRNFVSGTGPLEYDAEQVIRITGKNLTMRAPYGVHRIVSLSCAIAPSLRSMRATSHSRLAATHSAPLRGARNHTCPQREAVLTSRGLFLSWAADDGRRQTVKLTGGWTLAAEGGLWANQPAATSCGDAQSWLAHAGVSGGGEGLTHILS